MRAVAEQSFARPTFVREHRASLLGSIFLHALVFGFIVFAASLQLRHPEAVRAIQAYVVHGPSPGKAAPEPAPATELTQPIPFVAPKPSLDAPPLPILGRVLPTPKAVERKPDPERAKREMTAKLATEKAQADKLRETAQAQQTRAEQIKADKRRLADLADRSAREADLESQLAREDRRDNAERTGLLSRYQAEIRARVQRAWIRPVSARPGLRCIVFVTQVPGGEVTGVRLGECNGDAAVRQSIESAVYRASPLPAPPDPSLFERNLKLEFAPDA
jgi:outer membrane biosynthesis protein TonB